MSADSFCLHFKKRYSIIRKKLYGNSRERRKVMYNKVLALLQEEYPEVDFTSSDELVDEGILDSLTLTGIIAALSMEFDIEIPYDEIIEENFNSVEAMAEMVERLQA
jgi:acyl carrier protein